MFMTCRNDSNLVSSGINRFFDFSICITSSNSSTVAGYGCGRWGSMALGYPQNVRCMRMLLLLLLSPLFFLSTQHEGFQSHRATRLRSLGCSAKTKGILRFVQVCKSHDEIYFFRFYISTISCITYFIII